MSKTSASDAVASAGNQVCFVLMPISDPDGYVKGHFKHVYDDIITPACDKAGFQAVRADQVKQSNLIHLDILQKLLEAPMAVCDLSSRNPNVLFELALRQAFDKPVALVQEIGTSPIFDISPFRYAEYRKERTYHEVIEDQVSIATAIKDTFEAHRTGKGVNSIIKLLALSKPAALPELNAPEASADIQQLILAEVSQLREEVRNTRRESVAMRRNLRDQVVSEFEETRELLREAEMRVMTCTNANDLDRAAHLLDDCRRHWTRIIDNAAAVPPPERDMIQDFGRHVDHLERELRVRCDVLQKKTKK